MLPPFQGKSIQKKIWILSTFILKDSSFQPRCIHYGIEWDKGFCRQMEGEGPAGSLDSKPVCNHCKHLSLGQIHPMPTPLTTSQAHNDAGHQGQIQHHQWPAYCWASPLPLWAQAFSPGKYWEWISVSQVPPNSMILNSALMRGNHQPATCYQPSAINTKGVKGCWSAELPPSRGRASNNTTTLKMPHLGKFKFQSEPWLS